MAKLPSRPSVKQFKNKYTGGMDSYSATQPMNTQGDKVPKGQFKGDKKDPKGLRQKGDNDRPVKHTESSKDSSVVNVSVHSVDRGEQKPATTSSAGQVKLNQIQKKLIG